MVLKNGAVALALALLWIGPSQGAEGRRAELGPRRVQLSEAEAPGRLRVFLLGGTWRELWRTPIEVPVLDLAATAGGLRPVARVGSYQTLGLALAGADGRSYTFRSLAKSGDGTLPESLRWGPWKWLMADQASANFPGADLVVARLSSRFDIAMTPRRLGVMPDDPALGPHRAAFAGVVGTLAEYPQAGEPATFGATRIEDSEVLWQLARRGESSPVNARAYLRARLLDWWVGDWDRHPGQWRWARLPGQASWQPIPEDHDHAFSHYDGSLLLLIRPLFPWLGPFEPEPRVAGMNNNSEWLDAWILAGLDGEDWAREVERFLDRDLEALLDEALAALPRAWREQGGEALRETLRRRWASLPTQARRMYEATARVAHVHGSDADDRVILDCRADGSAELTLEREDGTRALRRVFLPGETERISLYLYGGDDRRESSERFRCAIEVRRELGPVRTYRGIPAPADRRSSGLPKTARGPRSAPF